MKYKFDLWLLHMPPVNLWNIKLIYQTAGVKK